MWICSQCGEEQDDQYDSCWKCQSARPAASSDEPASDVPGQTAVMVRSRFRRVGRVARKSSYSQSATARYADAYATARGLEWIGVAVKGLGLLFSLFIVVAAFGINPSNTSDSPLIGMVVAVVNGLCFYAAGALISSFGQNLKIQTDSAVNTSPFLSYYDRAEAMSLEPRSDTSL
jgi:hypothetical protein